MTKPRLAKVRALFYVLQQVKKRGCAYFDTASFLTQPNKGVFHLCGKFLNRHILLGLNYFSPVISLKVSFARSEAISSHKWDS